MTPSSAPPSVDIGLYDLLDEYLTHGDLVSLAPLGLFPDDKPRMLAEGFEPVGAPAEFNMLEKDVSIRHRRGWFAATLKPFYYGDRYISTGLALPWRRLRLSSLLRWLRTRHPARTRVLFHLVDAEQGALLVGETTAFHFHRQGRRYYVTTIETGSAAGEKPSWHYSAAQWVRRLMSAFGDAGTMRAMADGDAQVLAALAEIEPYFGGD
ncbi:hypothetical protein [Lysobacter sp. Root690]|uniref:hypothetical protein n=1 Tax=Lysobacter sp. Root690 TaxID=1736588 RepID=UPI000A62A646|nr:hypothetical protein [Lysobacter sp. Root690]